MPDDIKRITTRVVLHLRTAYLVRVRRRIPCDKCVRFQSPAAGTLRKPNALQEKSSEQMVASSPSDDRCPGESGNMLEGEMDPLRPSPPPPPPHSRFHRVRCRRLRCTRHDYDRRPSAAVRTWYLTGP